MGSIWTSHDYLNKKGELTMNEFIELEILTESGIIYEAGEYIEKLINRDFYSYTPDELKGNIKNLNSQFNGITETEIHNCNQIKCICNYIQPEYEFEHAIYQIEFVDKTRRADTFHKTNTRNYGKFY
jgi:hypothetical protein